MSTRTKGPIKRRHRQLRHENRRQWVAYTIILVMIISVAITIIIALSR